MSSPISNYAERDPVCVAIETALTALEEKGKGRLKKTEIRNGTRLQFGDYSVEALCYEIALVRLAGVMVGDSRYISTLRDALQAPMRESMQATR